MADTDAPSHDAVRANGAAPGPPPPPPGISGTPGAGGEGPVSTLRGAGVDVDLRRVGRVAGALCLGALAVVAVVLFVAGAQKNAQITRLRQHGVPVVATVTGCLGLLGGSGSNPAGYACTGTYTLHGHRYHEAIPGDGFRAEGSKVRGVADPGDPTLFSTAAAVAAEHASWHVFITPSVLVAVLAVLLAVVGLRRRRGAGA